MSSMTSKSQQRPNRILGLAIASVLAVGASSSFGGELKITYVDRPNTSSCNPVKTGPAVLANEIFYSPSTDLVIFPPFTCSPVSTDGTDNLDNWGTNGPAADGTYDDGYFYGTYKFTQDTLGTKPFYIQFTLDKGSFGEEISTSEGTWLDFVAHPSGSHSWVSKEKSSGNKGDTEATFYITPADDFSLNDTLFMRFNLQDLSILQFPGQEVKLGAKVYYKTDGGNEEFDGTTEPVSVVTSARSTAINSANGTAQIDPEQNCTAFKGDTSAVISPEKVKLGSIAIVKNRHKADMTEWQFDPDTTNILSTTTPGTLTITNGTFSASTTSPGKVFLDLNKDGNFTSGTDIQTTTLTANEAQWDLTADDLKNLYNADGANIIVEADGSSVIQKQSVLAQATFKMNYTSSNQDFSDEFSQSLLYVGDCSATPSQPPQPPLPATMKLTAGFFGNSHGRITTDPSGIDCDSGEVDKYLKCTHSFDTGTWVKFKVIVDDDSKFIRWLGTRSDCEDGKVFVNEPTGCLAEVRLLPRQLTVNVTGQGYVSSNPFGLACNDQCSHEFNGGEKVMLIATPKPNWEFEKWQGDCDDNGQVRLDKDKQCEAVFVKIPCTITPEQQWSNFYPASPNFGTILVGDSIALNQSIWFQTNQQCGGPLSIDKVVVIGNDAAEFQVKDTQCYRYNWWWYWGNNYSYSYCYFNTVFQPTTAGDKQAQLTFKLLNYEELSMPTVDLKAKAVDMGQAQLDFTPTEHDFGTVYIGRGSTQLQNFILKNTGEISLGLNNITLTGDNAVDFSLESWWCNSLGILHPNDQCGVNVWFSPTSTGQKQAELTVTAGNLTTGTAALTGVAEEPKDCSDANITIESVQSGHWDVTSTWSTATIPTTTDVVRINSGHTITGQAFAQVKTFCVQAGGILKSANQIGTSLEIQATDYLENKGLIQGKDGANQTQAVCGKADIGTSGCAQPGASVFLKVGTGFDKYGKMGDWWWYGSGGPILNTGEIIAGKGGDGSQYGAPGGDAIVLGRNTTNTNRIQAGDGGNILSDGTGEGGRGGLTQIWGKLGGPGHLYVQNGAQALAGNGGNCKSPLNQQIGGTGGNLWLVSLPDVHIEGGITRAGIGGQSCAQASYNGWIQIEPSIISLAGAATQVNGGNIAIYGGNEWTLDLSNLNGTVVEATDSIILAVGKDGIIDFRNSTGQILKAKEVQIFADKLLLDSGKSISDYIAADNIVVGPSRLLRNVSLSVANKFFGNPGEVISIPLIITNNGPETDQYTVTATDADGNILSQLTNVEIEGLNMANLAINLTIPVSNKVIFTAVSQADQEISSTSEVILATPVISSDDDQVDIDDDITDLNGNQPISASNQPTLAGNEPTSGGNQPTSGGNQPTPAGNEPTSGGNQPTSAGNQPTSGGNRVVIFDNNIINKCKVNSKGIIDWTCINKEQMLTDVTFGNDAKVSGGELNGKINNQGFVSQVTIQPDTILEGGIMSGYIVNHGILKDFEFVGAQVVGGTLAGLVINNSLIGGVFKDVTLAANAHLLGGDLQGEIQGDPNAPALLEDLQVQTGSYLEYVTIGDGVKLAADVTLGEGVQFNHPQDDPRLAPQPASQLAACDTELPLLGVTAINAVGQAIATQCQFAGGVAINGGSFEPTVPVRLTDKVEIRGTICVDPKDIGQLADLVVYFDYQPLATAVDKQQHYMLDAEGKVLPWDGDPAHLVVFQQLTLAALQEVLIYQGQLETTGKVKLSFGYRLMDGSLISNEQAIELTITDK
jgi:hypothetical protein